MKLLLNRIEKNTVVDQIVKQITDAIAEGQLKPGDKIPTEVELIKSLGVGRNSVREAIKMLSALGILEIRRGDGTYITRKASDSRLDSLAYSLILEQSTREEILELRETIEADILELAVEKATAEDVERLEELIGKFDEAFMENDFKKAAQLDLEFHYALIDTIRNPLLIRIAKSVLHLFFSSIQKTLQGYESLKGGTHKTHRLMVELIKNRDKDRIREVVSQSLEGWKNFI